jgi:uncharacterized SAM-binding protein YcdF (DUF218 family)
MATRLRALNTAIHLPAEKAVKVPAKEKGARRWRVVTIVVSCLVMWSFIAWVGAQLLIVKSETASADAIVVLGGSSTYLERADWAARLYQEGRAPVILLTNDGAVGGWNEAEQRNPYFYELAARELQRRGVPAAKILVVPKTVSSTYEESLELRDYALVHKLKRLQVVTSAYHSRRALWSFRRAFEGSEVEVGVDSPPPGWQTPRPGSWWLHRRGWKFVAGEYVKMLYYWTRY